MKQTNILLTSFLLLTLAGGVSTAQGVSKWKYVPQALKKTKIPGVLNPKLPLATRVQLAQINPVLDATVTRQATTQMLNTPTTALACPKPVADLALWLKELPNQYLAANDINTKRALYAVRKALLNYPQLPQEDKPLVNQLLISLNKLRPQIKNISNEENTLLIYTAPLQHGQYPQPDFFQLQHRHRTIRNLFYHEHKRPYIFFSNSFHIGFKKNNPQRIWGVLFVPGFTPQQAGEELTDFIRKLTPHGYTVRMGATELGLVKNSRTLFRQGAVHLHLEPPLQPGMPHFTTLLRISTKPYVGVMDEYTRQIIIPNNDQTIARNYLTIFESLLNEEGRQALQSIVEESPQ